MIRTTKTECTLANGFKLWERVYAQFSFFAIGIIGSIGILLVDWRWLVPYLLIYVYGILGIVMRHLTCPRCPHIHVHNDCLQLPPRITRWLIKEQKTSPFSAFEKFLFYMIFILIPVYPIYWLTVNKVLLIAFLLMVGMWYFGQFLYFCKKCRVYNCPFNRVSVTHQANRA